MKPQRIQLSRLRGWRMPPNTVSVARPTKWGNPFVVNPNVTAGSKDGRGNRCLPTAERAVEMFRRMLDAVPEFAAEARAELRGKNLACWCPIGSACHADVLLELANAESKEAAG